MPAPRYSKDGERIEGRDQKNQKKEETAEEKTPGTEEDLVLRVFLRFPIEARCRRLAPTHWERVCARPLHYL